MNKHYQNHLKSQNEVLLLSEDYKESFKDEILLIHEVKCLLAKDEKVSSLFIEGAGYDCFWDEDVLEVYGQNFMARFLISNQKIVDYTVKGL